MGLLFLGGEGEHGIKTNMADCEESVELVSELGENSEQSKEIERKCTERGGFFLITSPTNTCAPTLDPRLMAL